MNPPARAVQLAVRKERLRLRIAEQRRALRPIAAGVDRACSGVDQVRDGVDWARQHAPLLSLCGIAFLIVRPRWALRLGKGAWVSWVLILKLQRAASIFGLREP